MPMTDVASKPQASRLMERFNGTVPEEFTRSPFRTKFYASVEELQADLDEWLLHYNTERPHLGDRNIRRRPIETIEPNIKE